MGVRKPTIYYEIGSAIIKTEHIYLDYSHIQSAHIYCAGSSAQTGREELVLFLGNHHRASHMLIPLENIIVSLFLSHLNSISSVFRRKKEVEVTAPFSKRLHLFIFLLVR